MNNQFQDRTYLKTLYGNSRFIKSRGEFLKMYSNRKYSLRDIIILLLSPLQQKRVLDFGCGDCSFLKRFQKEYPKNIYYGLDIICNNQCLRQKCLKYQIYNGISLPKYRKKFDLILCMHTLYHVRNLNSVLNFLRINLKSYGTLVITTKSMHTLPWTETVFTDIVKKLKIDKYTKIKPVRDESHFCLENAECILHKAFSKSHYSIKKYVIETQLLVDSHRSFLKYIASTSRYSLDDKISKELGKKYWATWKKELEKQQLILDKFIEVIFIIKKR